VKVLVTGAAGFIGMHCARRLLARGDEVVGLDNLSPYYSVELKRDRLAQLRGKKFRFEQLDIADAGPLRQMFEREKPERVLHLAAQAGVRYSLENPAAYVQSNLVGFGNLLECCREHPPRHLVFASSSSVYGANPDQPWSESQNVDHPVSVYAATKKSNELMAHVYSHLYGLPMTGLRYFTVYGPWGRPDMSPMLFARAILEGKPIQVFNRGDMRRDFTYIDDIVRGVIACLDGPPVDDGEAKAGGSASPHAIYNIGNHRSEDLMSVVDILEQETGRKALLDPKPMQIGDVRETFADLSAIERDHGFEPRTSIDEGVPRFVAWYKDYHGIK
jgi:UDP-glucuronate 4-epimerase